MYVSLTLSQYDKQHHLKSPPCTVPSRSFVKAFLQLLYVLMSDTTSENIIDITNTSRSFDDETDAYATVVHPGLDSYTNHLPNGSGYSGGAGIVTDVRPWALTADQVGIIVGTSSTAVAVADDNLVTPIAHGSGAGQFVYYGCWGLNYTTGASSASFDVERIFRNSSGGSIVVAEIGMYAGTSMNSTAETSARAYCILRDVISPTVTVLNGEYLKVKYTITVSN